MTARPRGVWMWRKINIGRQRFHECISWRVERGISIMFRMDPWVGDGILRDQFLKIYAIVRLKISQLRRHAELLVEIGNGM